MLIGIVLAAGASTRMRHVKALLPADASGATFLSRIVETLWNGGLDDVVVVTGFHRAAIEAEVEKWVPPRRVRTVHNLQHEQGQLSSLQAALRIVDRPGVEGVVVTPVDAPRVKSETVAYLVAEYRRTHALLVRPAHPDGRHGHPVLFDRRLFSDLLAADPGAGAKSIVRNQIASGGGIEVLVDDPGAFEDVDTPDQYTRVVEQRRDPE